MNIDKKKYMSHEKKHLGGKLFKDVHDPILVQKEFLLLFVTIL